MKKVTLYTDGACSGNPGRGGWGVVLIYGEIEKQMSGVSEVTTNNQMELTAVIEGLRALKEPCEVLVYSDSAYVVNAFNQNWIEGWINNNWRNSKKDPVANRELWEELISLTKTHNVTFNKVKGHAGDKYNEICDSLATSFNK